MGLRSRRITGVQTHRQALASLHSGFTTHDRVATIPPAPTDCTTLIAKGSDTMTRIRFVAALIAALSVTSCASTVRIADLKDRPGHYEARTVSVHGVVTSSWGVPLVPFQFYNVDDGSGEVTVLARNGQAPSKGSRVIVRGRVEEVASFGSRSIGLHLEEHDRHLD
jgi:hypothetical protein